MKRLLKRTLFLTTSLLVLSSCAKEEFATNKGKQSTPISEAITSSGKLCAQSTLIKPQVDILMLWDNSTSFNFVNAQTKASMSNLIASVSEKFDYHVLSAPLVPASGGASSGTLFEAQLVASTTTGLNTTATSILRTKENATASLGFTKGAGAAEAGIDRAYNVLTQNRSNGIFRNGAYTIVVVISNEDDKGCSMQSSTNPNGTLCSSPTDYDKYLAPKIQNFLSLRDSVLNSTMMRFINISPLTSCRDVTGSDEFNYMYRKMAKTIYEAPYPSGWPVSKDHLSPDLSDYPDSYNLCSMSFSHIFDGVNTAIKETLLLHKYDYWPLASATTSVDPDTVRVVRSDGITTLLNRADPANAGIEDGFEVVMNGSEPAVTTINTRYAPTAGEPFYGKLIKLEGKDKVVYPECLTVTYKAVKTYTKYIYLAQGKPNLDTLEVRIDGKLIPKDASNGWDYLGLLYTDSAVLDPNFKIANLKAGTSSGYFLRLNGSSVMDNGKAHTLDVYYISAP